MSKIRIKQADEESISRNVIRIKRNDEPSAEPLLRSGPLVIQILCSPSYASCKTAEIRRNSTEYPEDDEDEDFSEEEELSKEVQLFIAKGRSGPASVLPAVAPVSRGMLSSSERNFHLTNLSEHAIPRQHVPQPFADQPPRHLPSNVHRFISPSASLWFKPDSVADIEVTQLTWLGLQEREYKSVRDEIISMYAASPQNYLSPRTIRENSTITDLAVVLRVWALVDYFGVINFAAVAPKHARRFLDFGKGIESNESPSKDCAHCRKPILFTAHLLKAPSPFLICPRCFAAGKYPTCYTEEFFEKIDFSPNTTQWSEAETLALLEGLERFGESDWSSIANHVNAAAVAAGLLQGGSLQQTGKTGVQCLIHFASLPIEERFVAPLEKSHGGSDVNPFRDVDNPLMALLSFLSASVHPLVASAAAKEAFNQVSRASFTDSVAMHGISAIDSAARQAEILAVAERSAAAGIFRQLIEAQAKRVEQKLSRLTKILPQGRAQ